MREAHAFTEALKTLAAEEKVVFIDQYHPLIDVWGQNRRKGAEAAAKKAAAQPPVPATPAPATPAPAPGADAQGRHGVAERAIHHALGFRERPELCGYSAAGGGSPLGGLPVAGRVKGSPYLL